MCNMGNGAAERQAERQAQTLACAARGWHVESRRADTDVIHVERASLLQSLMRRMATSPTLREGISVPLRDGGRVCMVQGVHVS